MKSIILLLVGLGVGLACGVWFFKSQPTPVAPTAAIEATSAPAAPPEVVVAAPKVVPVVIETKPTPAPVAAANSVASEPESEAIAAMRKTVDALLSPQTPLPQKHLIFEQLRTSGQLDQVIAELKRRVTEDPTKPEIATTLGEAMLNKVRQLHEAGADVNEVGILAMQADQSFNAALKLDPANWEAQFVKYSTMYYWPANEARDNEAAQKLSSLIDQQESQPPQPQFAQTYVVLGNQYQKMGKQDFAEATWRLGFSKFPDDLSLQKKIASLR